MKEKFDTDIQKLIKEGIKLLPFFSFLYLLCYVFFIFVENSLPQILLGLIGIIVFAIIYIILVFFFTSVFTLKMKIVYGILLFSGITINLPFFFIFLFDPLGIVYNLGVSEFLFIFTAYFISFIFGILGFLQGYIHAIKLGKYDYKIKNMLKKRELKSSLKSKYSNKFQSIDKKIKYSLIIISIIEIIIGITNIILIINEMQNQIIENFVISFFFIILINIILIIFSLSCKINHYKNNKSISRIKNLTNIDIIIKSILVSIVIYMFLLIVIVWLPTLMDNFIFQILTSFFLIYYLIVGSAIIFWFIRNLIQSFILENFKVRSRLISSQDSKSMNKKSPYYQI